MSGLLLTATPVSATGLGLGFGLGVRSEKHSTNASVKADLEAKADRYEERHDDRKNGTGSTVSAAAHIKVQERMMVHLTNKVKRSVTALVQLQKRICGASSDQAVVTACIAKAKVDIKASINAMIDVAFGS